MQVSQDFISTFWPTSQWKTPTEWFIDGQCQNRHQRQPPDFHPYVDFVPIKAWCFSHHWIAKNIFAIINYRNTASAGL
jgi:hypothetical protein